MTGGARRVGGLPDISDLIALKGRVTRGYERNFRSVGVFLHHQGQAALTLGFEGVAEPGDLGPGGLEGDGHQDPLDVGGGGSGSFTRVSGTLRVVQPGEEDGDEAVPASDGALPEVIEGF